MTISAKKLVVVGLLLIVALMGTAVTVTADEDGIFVIGIGSEPRTTDQQQSIDLFPPYVNYVCYDTLLRYIGDNPVPQPWLAKSYSVSEDGITYTFNLREGVQFIDGTPFNADAVVFTFDRLFGMGLEATSIFSGIAGAEVTAIDEYTVQFVIPAPFAPFPYILATPYGNIVSPGVLAHEVDGDWAKAWVDENTAGTGPYYLTGDNWYRGDRIILERNEDYWGEQPAFGQIIIKIVPEPSVLLNLLTRGDVDMIGAETLTADQLEELRSTPGIKVEENPSFRVDYLYLNCRNKYLSNAKVRQAVSYAIDYSGIIAAIKQGHAVQMQGPIPVGMDGHDEDLYLYQRDVARAKQLLAEAGYEDGFSLDLLIDLGVADWVSIATIVQSNLAEIGIEAEIQGYARPTMREMLNQGDFDIATGLWMPDYPDPDSIVSVWLNSETGGLPGNRSFYVNPRMDELLVAQRAETDPQKRAELLNEIQSLAVSEAAYVYLYQSTYQLPMRANIMGYIYNPSVLTPDFTQLRRE